MSDGAVPSDDDVERLLERHLSGLHAFVRLRANRAIRAQESLSDLVQSVCRELLEGKERFRFQGEAQFRSWLYTAALRKIVQRHRFLHREKRDVRRVAHERRDDDEAGRLLDACATITTPSMVVSTKEQMQALEVAFNQLTE
jgi:RNA polymerase sigma factor (sigma-70 family)